MKKSFTLIELLIVIGIMAIFTALTLSIMVSIRQQRQVKIVAEQVKARIMEAHSFAVSPKDNAISGLSNIQIQITNGSPATLQILEVSGNTLVPRYNLPSNISFTNSAGALQGITILFSATGSNIGQINSGTLPLVTTPPLFINTVTFKIRNTSNKTSTLKVNQYTGSVTIQ